MSVISRLFALLCLLGGAAFFPLCAAGQSNYQPALIVNTKGDTIRGTLDYSEWENSPKHITFKSDASGVPEKLTADQVRFFSVSVGHLAAFEGYVGPITTDNTDINRLSITRDSSTKIDTVFLRVLQDGKKLKLFTYTDAQKTRFFIAGSFADRPVELTYRVYWNSEEANGRDRTTYETAFKGQLYDEAVKAGVMIPSLKTYISKSEYRVEDIVYIASIINGISASDIAKNNKSKPNPLRTAIIIAGAVGVAIWVIHDFIAVGQNGH
jgi:hypothetical protein